MALICALVLPMFGLLLAQPVEADVSAQLKTVSSWNGGGQYSVVLSNSGSSPVCAVTYAISGATVSSQWNMEAAGGGSFRTPSWLQIGPGASDSSAGFIVSGAGSPSVSVVASTVCGGASQGGAGGGTNGGAPKVPPAPAPAPNPNPADPSNANGAKVSLGSVRQTIQGFGGSSAWMGAMSDAQMDTLFGNSNNNQYGLSLIRLRIDPGKNWGDELSNAQKASARGAQVFATPWTPPASMKSNNNVVGGSLNSGMYAAYADYLKSFVDAVRARGVQLFAISVNNEPDIHVTYESCDWTPQQLLSFVRDQGAKVGTRLIASESFHFDKAYTDPILNDPSASAKLFAVAGHIYGSGLEDYPSARNQGKQVWQTEHYNAGFDWKSMMQSAKEIHDCMTVGNYNAYLWWWFVDLNNEFISLTDRSGAPTKRGYILAQWSKYIRPGFTRVDAVYQPTPNVFLSAYTNGNKVVLVVVNTGGTTSQTFSLSGGSIPSSFTPHITSNAKSLSDEAPVSVQGGSFTFSLQAESVTTFVSN